MTPTFWSHMSHVVGMQIRYGKNMTHHKNSQLRTLPSPSILAVQCYFLSLCSRYRIEGTTLEEDGDILLSHHLVE